MVRLGELVGRPVVSRDTGAKMGHVADLLVDGDRVIGIILAGGILASEHVLPFREVHLLGEDTVIALTAAAVVEAKQWSKTGVKAQRLSALKHKHIVTSGGETLGAVGDIYVEPNGVVSGYDVETRGLGGLTKRHAMLPAEGVTVGSGALVVSEEAAAAFSKRDE